MPALAMIEPCHHGHISKKRQICPEKVSLSSRAFQQPQSGPLLRNRISLKGNLLSLVACHPSTFLSALPLALHFRVTLVRTVSCTTSCHGSGTTSHGSGERGAVRRCYMKREWLSCVPWKGLGPATGYRGVSRLISPRGIQTWPGRSGCEPGVVGLPWPTPATPGRVG